MLMKKVTVVAALLLFLLIVVKAKDGNVAGWKPNKTPEMEGSEMTAPPFVFNVTETTEPVRLMLDLAARGGYTAFMTELHNKLVMMKNGRVEGLPVLGVQNPSSQPDTWIYVVLKTGQGETSTLAIRADNLYLVGFQPNEGPWYVFKNTYDWFRRGLSRLPIALTFNDNYKSLTGGRGLKYLHKVYIGQRQAWEAAENLARYRQGGPVTEEKIREALLTFVLMICEAQRFTSINATVTKAWEHGYRYGRLPYVEVELVVQWRNISCALLGWNKTRYWQGIPEAHDIANYGIPKMTSPWNALANLNVILRAKTCK